MVTWRLYFLKEITRNGQFSRPAETDPYEHICLQGNRTGPDYDDDYYGDNYGDYGDYDDYVDYDDFDVWYSKSNTAFNAEFAQFTAV